MEDPSGTREAFACRVCGRVFGETHGLALHRARDHEEALEPEMQARVEEALRHERAWMQRFRSHLAGGLAASVVLFTYIALVLSSYILRANPVFVALPAPGILIFTALTYWFVYKHRQSVEQRDADTEPQGIEAGPKPGPE